jgi:hypothetical protein
MVFTNEPVETETETETENYDWADRLRAQRTAEMEADYQEFRNALNGSSAMEDIGRALNEDFVMIGTGMHQRFVPRGYVDTPVVKYNYKLCGDFSDIREFLEFTDLVDGAHISVKSIHTVESTGNGYDTEFMFSSFKTREYLQEVVDMCDYPEDMALTVMKD